MPPAKVFAIGAKHARKRTRGLHGGRVSDADIARAQAGLESDRRFAGRAPSDAEP